MSTVKKGARVNPRLNRMQQIDPMVNSGRISNEVLDERVRGTEDAIKRLTLMVENLSARQETMIAGLSDKISTSMAAQGRTNWPIFFGGFSIILAVLGSIGALTYWPMRADLTNIEAKLVPRSELIEKWKTLEGAIEMNRENYKIMENRYVEDLKERIRVLDRDRK